MAKIRFNKDNNNIFPISSFNRNSTFSDGQMTSYAYISAESSAKISKAVQQYGISGISSIDIYDDANTAIYSLDNLAARVSALDETLNGTMINMTLNIEVKDAPASSNV